MILFVPILGRESAQVNSCELICLKRYVQQNLTVLIVYQ